MRCFGSVLFVMMSVLLPLATSAQLVAPCTGDIIPGTNPPERMCTFCDALRTGQNIFIFLISIAVAAAGIGIMIGGFYILLAGAKRSWYEKGVSILKAAVTGLVITLTAWVIVNTIIVFIANPSQFPMPWNRITCR